MKKYKVFAERVVVEVTEVEAESEGDAIGIAQVQDNDRWEVSHDADWQITSAKEVQNET